MRRGTGARLLLRRLPGDERGAELIEFALVSLLLFMLLFGITDFGRALYAETYVAYAARAGTRYAMVRGAACNSFATACPATSQDVQTYLRRVPGGITPASVSVTTTWLPDNRPGSRVNVRVSYAFRFIFPLLGATTHTMVSSSESVISQ
jgi:Flp pilus assembly protein TadG